MTNGTPQDGSGSSPRGKTSVYLYFDRAGRLLYVGITSQRTGRQSQHSQDKDWWQYVASQEVEHFDTREQAADREKTLIQERRPPFNKANNPGWERIKDAYLAVLAAEETLIDIQSGHAEGFSYLSPCGGHCWMCRSGDPGACEVATGHRVDRCPVCESVGCGYPIGLREGELRGFSNLDNSRKYLAGLCRDKDECLAKAATEVIDGMLRMTRYLNECGDQEKRAIGGLIDKYLVPNSLDHALVPPRRLR